MGLSFESARVTNSQLAGDGMDLYPEALGVLWAVDLAKTAIWCRDCLDATRSDFADLPGDQWGYAVSAGDFSCARCGRRVQRDFARPPQQGAGAGPGPISRADPSRTTGQ